jgi:hypothetical protein
MNVELAPPPVPLAGSDLGYLIVVAASAAVSLAALALVAWWLRRAGRESEAAG